MRLQAHRIGRIDEQARSDLHKDRKFGRLEVNLVNSSSLMLSHRQFRLICGEPIIASLRAPYNGRQSCAPSEGCPMGEAKLHRKSERFGVFFERWTADC